MSVHPKTDPQVIENPGEHDVVPYLDGTYDPSRNQWVGPITSDMLKDWGKFVTFGPAPPGMPSEFEALILLVGLKKLGETPEGLRILRDIAVQYLRSLSNIITELSQSSSAHVVSCCVNQYVACTIYQRLGLMSPHDATQTRAWIDHQIGEALLTERAGQSLGALTTLVRSTTTGSGESGEGAAGLGAFAKILGSK